MSLQSIQEIIESYIPNQPETVYSEKYEMHVNNIVNTFKTDEQTDIELMKLGFTIDRIIVDSPVSCGDQIYLYTRINKP
jgi:hypothetical protein